MMRYTPFYCSDIAPQFWYDSNGEDVESGNITFENVA